MPTGYPVVESQRFAGDPNPSVEDRYGLTPLQEGMLFHTLRDTGVGMYVNQVAYLMQHVDVEAMRTAWQRIIDRHTILRTSFNWENLEFPEQIVHPHVELPFFIEDWRGEGGSIAEMKLRRLLRNDREKGFDLLTAPLLRVFLLHLTDESWYFVFTHHHLLLDGWSKNQLNKELRLFYDAARVGSEIRSAPARPFRDYIDYLEGLDAHKAETFWRRYLDGITAPTSLPAEIAASHRMGRRLSFGEWSITVPERRKEELLEVARQCHVTLNTVLLGAWGILMSRYCGQRDVLFGMLVSGRPAGLAGSESMVGMFLNALPVRVRVKEEEVFSTWLENLQVELAEFREYEHTALRSIQEWVRIPKGTPLYECIVVNTNTLGTRSGSAPQPQGMASRAMASSVQQNVPLHLDMETVGADLLFKMTYDARRFEGASITRLMEHLQSLLESIAENPERRVADLQLMTARERQQILVEWNRTECPIPKHEGLFKLFEQQTDRVPNAEAVRFRGESRTYRELNSEANRLAHFLRGRGVACGAFVGICIPRSFEMVTALLAVLKSGAAFVPLDPGFPRERLDFMLQDSGVKLILAVSPLRNVFSGGTTELICIDESASDWAETRDDNPESVTGPEDLAYILYTSGSTGTPKGVAIPHRVAINRLHTEHNPIGPDEAFCAKTTLNFVDSIWELFSAWTHGLCVTLIPEELLSDPARLVDALAESKATRLVLVPSLLRNLLESELPLAERLPKLRHWISSGEPLSPDLCRKFAELLPDRILTNLYGTSEVWDATRCDSRDRPPGEALPIGRAMGNVRAYILDADLRPVPVGVRGELFIGGAGLASGYWNRPELTEHKFVRNPFLQGERLYRTGDEVRWLPDGNIEHLGRLDQQFKLRGFRIETGEIESVLRRHSGLRNVAIAVTESEQLAAFVVPVEKGGPDIAALRKFARQHLPEVMRPSLWRLLDTLALTPSGKVDRRALLKLGTGVDESNATDASEQLETKIEKDIAEVWKGVLGIPSLGLRDNVFEMGAHSLAATRAAVRLGKALGMQVPLKAVFEHPTVEALAGWFGKALKEGEKEEALPELQRAERGREAPLSYAQRRMWFLDQLDPGSVSYTVPNSIQFHGELGPDKLEAALNEIVRRHGSLRTTFLSREGEPFQIIHEPQPVRLPRVDFSALPPSERQEAARTRAREQARQPWDLKNGPLFRVQLIRTAFDEHLFVLTMHHIITDGRSMGVLAQELGILYRAFVRNRSSPLPAPPVQYADFAVWQRDWLRGNLLEKQLRYWRTRLADLPELELPTDFPRPKVHHYRGGRASFSISRTTANSLNALARSVGATPFMTLLAGFDVFLSTISGQRDVCVGTPVANRNKPELENIIGLFVNTLVMRAQIEGDPTFRQLLKQVRERCLEAFDHEDLPFEKLVDELSPARDLSRHPLFQVMFVHQEGAQGVELPGISFRQRAAEMETSNFDLLFLTSETADGYDGILQYNSDLFREETVARFAEQFAVWFERLAAAPDLPLSQISPFAGNELDSILEWSQGPSRPAGSRLIQDWLATHAQAAPARLVAETESGSLSYGQLDRLSNHLAHSLREAGLGPDRIAGLCVERSSEMLVGLFGILKAGGAFLAIDPEYPDERIALMLEDAAVQIVVAQDTFRDRLKALVPNGALVVHSPDCKEASSDRGDEPPPVVLQPENLAYIIFTSGSTGRPKGVLVEHRNAVRVIEAQLAPFGIDASSRVLQTLSVSFDAALGEIFRAISAGATLFLARRDQLMSGPGLVALMRERHITAVALPPTVLGALPTEAAQELQELRTLTVGGEACPPHLAKRWGEVRHIVNGYGPTETTIGATVAVDWNLDMKPPLGRPLANATIYVLDANMRPVRVGVPGELFIGGAGVTRGYLNRAELTAEAFVPDPFSDQPGRRLYRTGDRVRWLADRQLEFLGRKDFQVKIRGFRIEPGEIAAVVQRHDAVDQCVVDVREDRGVRRLIGYATRKSQGNTVSSSELRAFVKERLPDYMVPSTFVFLDAIPMTLNGKVDYKNLPQPDLNTLFSETEYVAPRNDLEERLAKIWQQVIGIEKVGIHANFFELGGDSILSIQMVARATEMGIAFSVRDVFEHQTIAELALVAERRAASEADQGPVTGEVPLTPIQRWYFEQNSGEPAHFNHSMTLPANPAVFRKGLVERALQALCNHHDALRARFRRDEDGQWKQIFAEPGDVPVIESYDLSALSEQERKTTIEERRDAAHRMLNLGDGPIFRVLLFNFGSGVPGRMVLILHHLVTDIVSWQILVQDLMTAIQKTANGGSPHFPPKTTSHKRWAELLAEYAESSELKSQVDYWLDPMRLDVGRLPVDYPAGKNARSASAKYTNSLDEDETRRLLESLPRQASVTVRDILVTALVETLCRWSKHPRIVIDLEGHGREEIGSEKVNLSRTIGWFTSFYPALLELAAGDELRNSLNETARRLDAVPSRGLGYGVIRYLLSDELVRDRLSSLPQAEVAFNYTGHGGHGRGRGTNESEALSVDIGQIMLSQSAKRPRQHLFEIVAGVAKGRLVIRWGYSANTYATETVAHVSERFLQNLRRLLARLDEN